MLTRFRLPLLSYITRAVQTRVAASFLRATRATMSRMFSSSLCSVQKVTYIYLRQYRYAVIVPRSPL